MKRLLVVGVLLLASGTASHAGPVDTQPANWFAQSCASVPAARTGFLFPTLAGPVPDASPRLVVTQNALHGTVSMRMALTTGQAQAAQKPQKSWFRRNWWWVVPVAYVVVAGAVCLAAGCGD